MKIFWTILALGLAFISVFNWMVDPLESWSRAEISLHQDWPRTSIWLKGPNSDERKLRFRQIELHDRPSTVALGNSKTMFLAKSPLFDDSFLNLSVTGAKTQDQVVLWSTLVTQGKTPTRVLLFVEPETFFTQSGVNWLVGLDEYVRFVRQHEREFARNSIERLELGFLPLLIVKRYWVMLKALLSDQIFLESVTRFKNGTVRKTVSWDSQIVSADAKPPESFAVRWDGSWQWPQSKTLPRTAEEIRTLATALAYEPEPRSWTRSVINEKTLLPFDSLLQDIRSKKAELIVIFLPMPPSFVKAIGEINHTLPDSERILLKSEEAVRIARQRSSKMCDFVDSPEPICGESEYIDALHFNEGCLNKIVRNCLD